MNKFFSTVVWLVSAPFFALLAIFSGSLAVVGAYLFQEDFRLGAVGNWALRRLRLQGEPQGSSGMSLGMDGLIGSTAEVKQGFDTETEDRRRCGVVWIQGERWSAETEPGAPALSAGSPVRVKDVHGLTLLVEPVDATND
jgi:membrane protein implicated in regulation of membrane protease activity